MPVLAVRGSFSRVDQWFVKGNFHFSRLFSRYEHFPALASEFHYLHAAGFIIFTRFSRLLVPSGSASCASLIQILTHLLCY